jgi:iron(III) transport system permease protein
MGNLDSDLSSLPSGKRLAEVNRHGWTALAIAIAALVATPILFVLSSIFTNSAEVWSHLATTVLGDYVTNSLWLLVGVSCGVLVIGVGTAWLVTMCRFPGSVWFEWSLLLPLSTPSYLLAYTYADMLDYYGPVQLVLRSVFGWEKQQDYWFPNIHSLGGAIAMLTLGLYPYVYLLARVAFLEMSVCTLEASRSLGCNPWRSFFTVALPLARPSIVAGLALALMETLNDFGTVQHFGVSTFTTGIYRTWFGLGDRPAASQLAASLLSFILVLIVLENWSRRQARYYQRSSSDKTIPKYQLGFARSFLAWIACFLPVALGLVFPVFYLLQMTVQNAEETLDLNFWNLATNSFTLSAIGAFVAVAIGTILAYGQRLQPNWSMNLAVRTSSMGYAIPGSVIAVGVLIPIGNFDNAFDSWMRSQFGISTGLLLSGTIFTLIFAYIVRFLAVAFGTIESSLHQISPSLDDASRSLGYTPGRTLWKVHLPLMWRGLLTAGILVFVDVMKELSATIVIRPFNFDTLAIRVYQYASDERLVEASAPALAIIVVGVIPVILLSLRMTRSHGKNFQNEQE